MTYDNLCDDTRLSEWAEKESKDSSECNDDDYLQDGKWKCKLERIVTLKHPI